MSIQTYINTLPAELKAVWDQYAPSPDSIAKWENKAAMFAKETMRLSKDSRDEVVVIWGEQATLDKETAAFLLSTSEMDPNKDNTDEWRDGIMRCLIKYAFNRYVINLLENAKPALPPENPPKRDLGESLEHYKTRLLSYANSLS